MAKSLTSTATKTGSKTSCKTSDKTGKTTVRDSASGRLLNGKTAGSSTAYKSADKGTGAKNGGSVSKNVQQGNKHMEEAWALISQRSGNGKRR